MATINDSALRLLVSARNRCHGQGFVEYIMIVGLVGITLGAALVAFRNQISDALNSVGSGV